MTAMMTATMTATMAGWEPLFQRPEDRTHERSVGDWFDRIASRLLNGCRLVVAGQMHRLVEIELYYHGEGHLDVFTHCDPWQQQCGRWYFHRSGGGYRGGSFKGLDVTFGDGAAFGGILLRGLETPEGRLVDGPSLLVDHLLSATAAKDVAALDAKLAGQPAWAADSPLRLEELAAAEQRPVYRSGRVGLSLKKSRGGDGMFRFILQPYRYLTEPRRTAKGKALLVLALHAQGIDADTISRLTGCPRHSVKRYPADYAAGQAEPDFAGYVGVDLKPRDLCRLIGAWHAVHGQPPSSA